MLPLKLNVDGMVQMSAGKTHEQVKAEQAEARASGWLNRHIGA